MPGELHSALVAHLRHDFPGSRTQGWRRALLDAVPDAEGLDVPVRVPDVFIVDEDNQRAVVFEVEVGAPLNGERLLEWACLWSDLDAFDWELRLCVVDRLAREHETNLQKIWYADLARKAAA